MENEQDLPETPIQETPQEHSKFTFSIPIVAGIAILALFFGGVMGYFVAQTQTTKDQVQIQESTSIPVSTEVAEQPTQLIQTDETKGWKTYTNNKYGVEFKYSPSWQFREQVYKKEYEPKVEFATTVMLDPVKLPSKEQLETLDIPLGSVSIRMSTEDNKPIGYESFKDVEIGVGNSIQGKVYDKISGTDVPNGVFADTHSITYYLGNNKGSVTVSYLSGLTYQHTWISNTDDQYLEVFNQILSTFKFLD